MAKKLVYDYTIDASASKISVKENHLIETLLIITDITIGKILYKFASPDFGYVSSTYNSTTEYTEIVLEQNLSGLGVNIVINADKPNASNTLIVGNPNICGINQFQSKHNGILKNIPINKNTRIP